MGTVDFWVPVNRHRREPGGPHDIISTSAEPNQPRWRSETGAGTAALREREQKWYARRFGHYSQIPTLPSSRFGCAT